MQASKEEVIKIIGHRIREIRLSKGLSIEKVALDAGMEYTQLSRIELGKINTSIFQVYKLSNSLKVSIIEIFHTLNK